MNKFTLKLAHIICFVAISNFAIWSKSTESDISRNLQIFNDVFKTLNYNYVDTIDANKAINNAINYMLYELDPYTNFFNDTKDYENYMTGEYGGIGCTHIIRDSCLYIYSLNEGNPAQKSGLKYGDQIIAVNNDTLEYNTLDKVSEKIRGDVGTNVKLTIKRTYPTDTIITFNITREKIKPNIVPFHGVIHGDIGYIYLTEFKDDSYQLVKECLLEFKNNPNVKSVILDLRDNPGGQVNSCIDILSLFLPKNTFVIQSKGKGNQVIDEYKTNKKPIDTEIPLAILINNNSASASEVVSGTIQDYDRGIIVGQRSFGKGLVQRTFKTSNNTYLKVTIAKYYLPSGRLIQALDYSKKDANGTASTVPDSLISTFKTKNGREVKNGRGITPDIVIENKKLSNITNTLYSDYWIFDYANHFAATTPSIASPNEFVITDSIFNDFKNFIKADKIKYDKKCEELVDLMSKTAKDEGYMNDNVKSHLDALKQLLQHDLYKDIDNNRKEIEKLLSDEIIERYYYRRGIIEGQIKYDETINEAASILHDAQKYKSILKPQNSKK